MLANKLAFVTGAGSGIGRATCIAFCREGAKVIACDKNAKSAQETLNLLSEPKVHLSLEVNVNNRESVAEALKTSFKKYSKPANVVVNCAGITRDDFLLKMDPLKFQEVINVNLIGTYNVVKEACTILVEEDEPGSIITVGSIVGQMGNIGQANYAASKAGVEALTKSVAKELGMFQIRCNAVIPGFIQTPMTQTVPDKVKKMFTKLIPLARFGEPEAVIDLDNDSENLLTALINKVDGFIDPKVIDSKNATQELAYALLRTGPVLSITGNITDETRGFALSFTLSAQADTAIKSTSVVEDDDTDITGSEGGMLQPMVSYLEPYLLNAASIVFNGVMSNMIANFMHELSLLSSTNLC